MFLIFKNDIAEQTWSHIRFFADNCLLYRTIDTLADTGKLQDDLNRLWVGPNMANEF